MYALGYYVHLFESNLNVPVNIFSLLTELWCCLSYVKQASKEIWRENECFMSHSSTGGVWIEPVKSNTQDRTCLKMACYL